MKVYDCEQGSPEWFEVRIGKVTASRATSIMTPKTRKRSAQSFGYMCELLAESVTGMTTDPYVSEWMARGQELEPQARAFYEFHTGSDVHVVGFCESDRGMYGCSPDGLVGDDGGIEIKCPSAKRHVELLLESSDDYIAQVQFSLLVTGRDWWDRLSYHPDFPPALTRFERDDDFICDLAEHLDSFLYQMETARKVLESRGINFAEAGRALRTA